MLYTNLFRPIKIGTIEVKNRIVMPPMNTNFADPSGHVNQRFLDYYVTRARGGVGLIIISAAYVDERAKRRSGNVAIYDDIFVEGLKTLAREIKSKGAVAFQQLNHVGRLVKSMTKPGFNVQPIGPSAIPHLITGEMCKELTTTEIREIVIKFAHAARRVKNAGFDGLEIHGAHGYLLNQFLSPHTNRRRDEYGGSLSGRMKFPLDVIKEVRGAVGGDFPISYRLSAKEFVTGGLEFDEVKAFTKELEKAGINILHISGGGSETHAAVEKMVPPMSAPSGCNVPYAEEIKRIVNIPVIVAGKINTPDLAEEIILKGQSDMVAMGRALIADPELPRKAREGREKEIRRCIYCNQGCWERLIQEMDITCTVNPMVGKERKFEIISAKKSKKVFVIGGGPSGLEAARITALRGHRVTLFERSDRIGGQVLIACLPPGKRELENIIDFYTNDLSKLKVPIVFNFEVKKPFIDGEKPDVVIVATGGNPIEPDLSNLNEITVLSAHKALKGHLRLEGEIAIIGGGQVGLEVGVFFAHKGYKIKIIEMLEDIGSDLGPFNKYHLKEDLETLGVDILCNTRFVGIGLGNSIEVDSGGMKKVIYGIKTIIFAIGSQPNNTLVNELRSGGFKGETVTVGDCIKPRKILDAIAEGFEEGLKI